MPEVSFDKLKVGVIGCGMMGRTHINNLLNFLKPSQIVVSDVKSNLVEKIKKELLICDYELCYKNIIKRSDVSAIIIATPPWTHYEILKAAIRSDKHILIEKPLCTEFSELEKIESLTQGYEKVILDCSSRHARFNNKYEFVKDFINSEELGEIYFVHHNAVNQMSRPGIEYHPSAKWYLQTSLSGGGAAFDWGVYDFSFHLGVLQINCGIDQVRSLFFKNLDNKYSASPKNDVEEHAIAMLRFGSINYYYERSSNAHNKEENKTRIYGCKGGLKFNYLSSEGPEVFFYNKHGVKKINIEMNRSCSFDKDHEMMTEHFLQVILGKTGPIQSFQETIRIMRTVFHIRHAAWQKSFVC